MTTYKNQLMRMKRNNLRANIVNSVTEHPFPSRKNASRANENRILNKMVNLSQAKNLTSLASRLNSLSNDPAINPRFVSRVKFYAAVARNRARKKTLANRYENLKKFLFK